MSAAAPFTPAQLKVLYLLRGGHGHMHGASSPGKRGGRNTVVRELWRAGWCRPNPLLAGQYVLTKMGYEVLRDLEQALRAREQEAGE